MRYYRLWVSVLAAVTFTVAATANQKTRPNIVLILADDLGWGDVAYNGHKHVKTPALDALAKAGIRFDRYYAAAPVCSPTRGSVMTGRHPARFGCFNPNFSIRPQETTIAEVLRRAGYRTGHFGKWHLGPVKMASPVSPGGSGFDTWVSHDNWFDLNPPLSRNGADPVKQKGESSDVVMDHALEFIRKNKAKPFFAYICFASPHLPHQAIDKDLAPYSKLDKKLAVFLAEITALDRNVGRLRAELRKLGIADNTIVIFCSDNGAIPIGSTGGLRGRKGSLYEGGVRVPAILEWPSRIKKGRITAIPVVSSDWFPTLLDLAGAKPNHGDRPMDGISITGLIDGKMKERPTPIAFWKFGGPNKGKSYLPPDQLKGWWRTFTNRKYNNPRDTKFPGHAAITDNRWKLHQKGFGKYELYDLLADRSESKDVAGQHADVVRRLAAQLHAWQRSVEQSLAGADYSKKNGVP